MTYRQEFIKTHALLSRKHDAHRVFSDFLEMSALSLVQPFLRDESLEKRYLGIAGHYTKDELKQIARMLAMTVEGLEEKPHDFLGEICGEVGLFSKGTGQFFTPYHVCQLIAQMTITESSLAQIEDYMMFNEPCCGGGAMVIAAYEHMRNLGFDTQNKAFVVAQDISPKAFHMAYIQLSLLDIPGQVILGNTLALESIQCWPTPTCYFYNWNNRLKQPDPQAPEQVEIPQFQFGEQMQLF